MDAFNFHPAVAQWFQQRFGTPTEPQAHGWPAIQSGQHVLISAPTGSGKTLAAFLASLDQLFREAASGKLPDETRVVYVSPLKALSNDIRKNLEEPLAGIRAILAAHGQAVPEVRAEVRTGDTPAVKRQAIAKKPPHILVTTPESLYLLLTSESGRRLLRAARTLIVDEIHAVVGNRRGSHLALTMERLEALTGRSLQRIGLSATQKPIEDVAQFLVGTRPLEVRARGNGEMNAMVPLALESERGASLRAQSNALRSENKFMERENCAPRWESVRSAELGCVIIELGRRRELDLAFEIPKSPLEAVMSNEVWEEVYTRLAELIEQHQTTLVFVNTRRLAERVTHHLSERLGADKVASHHGSLSAKLRLDAENRLKRGELKALVATASLELGIDIGSVDLVCQLGSTRSISTLLQRVGRAEHKRGGLPKGRLFPLTRDELVECASTIRSLRRSDLDSLIIPEKPLDILAQQIVACAAGEDWSERDLFELMRRAHPYRHLSREEFDSVVQMLAEGFSTKRGRRGALIHYDAVHGRIRARRGARLIALTSGGAIPDNAEYRVVLAPTETFIGTVNEDFAIESMAGDIFQLGNASWKILGINSGMVRVEDAQGKPPSIPFWFGEAPARTDELSRSVAELRQEIERRISKASTTDARSENLRPASSHSARTAVELGNASALGSLPPHEPTPYPSQEGNLQEVGLALELEATQPTPYPSKEGNLQERSSTKLPSWEGLGVGSGVSGLPQSTSLRLTEWLAAETGLSSRAALQIAEYFAAVHRTLGVIPSQATLVIERFFDESGGMQLVIHSPWGSRINRAWGLALRKRFCRKFNFELQAAATDDAIVLSLGAQHSFPLEEVFHYLHSNNVREVLVQALLDAPMFTVRWRWNVARALAVPRQRGGRRTPPPLQRMEAEDLIAAVFPDQLACLENIVGDREIPDHPLANQTIHDCLTEAMDTDGLVALLKRIEAGTISCVAKDLPEPSPLAHEILNAKPYAFLDNAPLEERRTQAVYTRRALDSASNAALGILDAAAIQRVREEARPSPVNADEMHDALMQFGVLWEGEIRSAPGSEATAESNKGWPSLLASLADDKRATRLKVDGDPRRMTVDNGQANAAAPPSHEGSPGGERVFWVAAERLRMVQAVYPDSVIEGTTAPPEKECKQRWERAEALRELLRGRLELSGPVRVSELSQILGISKSEIQSALIALESEGFILRGRFRPETLEQEWCERRLLARIHRLTINRLRAEIQPVSIAEFFRFLTVWQRVDPEHQVEGPEGVATLLELLDGYELAAGAWEPDVLCVRVKDYEPQWLDRICFTGRVGWGRLTIPQNSHARSFSMGPLRSSPVSIYQREHLSTWLALCDPTPELNCSPDTAKVFETLLQGGALFFSELVRRTGLLPSQAEQALGELVAVGLVTADSFEGLRALLLPAHKKPSLADTMNARRRKTVTSVEFAGRWSLLRQPRSGAPSVEPETSNGSPICGVPQGESPSANLKSPMQIHDSAHSEKVIETYARVLLRRYGVVFRRILEREAIQLRWYELGRVFRRFEARGEIRGGYFVSGVSGEQFALPDAIHLLRSTRKEAPKRQLLPLSAADPLNLVGILTPGRRVTAIGANRILLRDGVPVAAMEAGQIIRLDQAADESDIAIEQALKIGKLPPLLRPVYS